MNDSVVEVIDVFRTFSTGQIEVHALRGVTLTVTKGEFTAVAGPSGSGKTTLFNLIGGLDEPTSGRITLAGNDLASMKPKQRSRLRLDQIGFVFQAYNLIPVLTAYENVEYPLILKNVPTESRRETVRKLLAAVGIEEMMDRRPNQMSGGQQQRVAIARSLVCDPSIVLADEPTANVDSETGAALLTLMKKLNTENGVTFLFSTHDPMVMDAASRLVRLKDGRIESDERR